MGRGSTVGRIRQRPTQRGGHVVTDTGDGWDRRPASPAAKRRVNRFHPGVQLTPGIRTPDVLQFKPPRPWRSTVLRSSSSCFVACICSHRKSSSIIHAHSQHIFSHSSLKTFKHFQKKKNLFYSLPVLVSQMPKQQNRTASCFLSPRHLPASHLSLQIPN